jgi:predicted AAA+ superfamily ATPase
MLSGELATYLGGRYVEIEVYPFSFREALDYHAHAGESIDQAQAVDTVFYRECRKQVFGGVGGSVP